MKPKPTPRYENSFIKSPIDGVVLRKHHREGESVANSVTTPDPVLTIGDTQVRSVQVDIDEADVNKLRVGQAAYVYRRCPRQAEGMEHVVHCLYIPGSSALFIDSMDCAAQGDSFSELLFRSAAMGALITVSAAV